MGQGFIEKQGLKFAKSKRVGGISLLIVGVLFLALAAFVYSAASKSADSAQYATLSAVMFAIPGIVLLLVSIPLFVKARKASKEISEYGNLTVASDNYVKKNVAETINNEMSQGKILIEL